MKWFFALLAVLAAILPATAKVKTEMVEYKQGDVVLQGFICFDESLTGKRPGILVIHDWMGVSDDTKMRAEMLAGLGYVALTADIYGKGVRPHSAQEAMAESGKYFKDRPLLRARAKAGLDFLMSRPEVDPARLAVMGYCFGGGASLELARSGAPVKAVVTFHGSLSTPTPDDAKNIKGKVLVLHGADDPYVKQADVTAFMDEMRKGGVDWELVQYSGAVHAFTIKGAGSDKSTGAAYNAEADRRSWIAMKDFFSEVLGGGM
jgi:dienelactone hydrolase